MSKPLATKELDATVDRTESQEANVVRRAQDGDAEAFADLVTAYQRRAVSVAYRLLGNAEDASDVSQDSFVRAYQHLGQLEDPTRFAPWLFRIVSNLALNYRRARKAKAATSLDDPDGVPIDACGALAALPDGEKSGALSQELRGAIDAAMEHLPDKQRLALVLFSVEGMPQKDVAEILQCSVELVKWNVFQARKKLKELLREFL